MSKNNVSIAKKIEELFCVEPQIEIIGNKKALIQGFNGILEYCDDKIRLSLCNLEVEFCGANLTLNCLSGDSLEISGIILEVKYR